jgi:hypothetical protein
MPKPKPSQIIRHEIVLGRREHDLLAGVAHAQEINLVSEPIVEILKDASALLAIAAILEAAGVTDWLPDWILESVASGAYGSYQEISQVIDELADAADAAAQAARDLGQDVGELAEDVAALPGEIGGAVADAPGDLLGWILGGISSTAPGAPLGPAIIGAGVARRKGAKAWAWLQTQAQRLQPPTIGGPFGGPV